MHIWGNNNTNQNTNTQGKKVIQLDLSKNQNRNLQIVKHNQKPGQNANMSSQNTNMNNQNNNFHGTYQDNKYSQMFGGGATPVANNSHNTANLGHFPQKISKQNNPNTYQPVSKSIFSGGNQTMNQNYMQIEDAQMSLKTTPQQVKSGRDIFATTNKNVNTNQVPQSQQSLKPVSPFDPGYIPQLQVQSKSIWTQNTNSMADAPLPNTGNIFAGSNLHTNANTSTNGIMNDTDMMEDGMGNEIKTINSLNKEPGLMEKNEIRLNQKETNTPVFAFDNTENTVRANTLEEFEELVREKFGIERI
jgi:hypothetical protein